MDTLRILMVEDEEAHRVLAEREIKKSGLRYSSVCVETRAEFLKQLTDFNPNLILCDFSLPQFGALDALSILNDRKLKIPLIIVTGALTDEKAVECIKNGAIDYVLKDKIVRLPVAIKSALEVIKSRVEKEKAEGQLQVITDILPASLSYISKDFVFQFCNHINEVWFGRDIVGKHLQDVLGRDVFENIQSGLPKLLAKEQLKFESTLSNANAPRFVSMTLIPDLNENGSVKGFVCLITNITDQKNYENELKDAKKSAEAANSAKSQFLANMSHEMRTPLNVITGLSELLLVDFKDEEERTVWIEKIRKNSDHLKDVINEILDLSKIEAGKLQVQLDRFSVVDTIAQIKSTLIPLAHDKGLELLFEPEGKIPEFINSDAVKLRHILLNVLGNAIKFSSQGTISLKVKLEKKDNKESLNFSVKDHGVGMSQEQAKHLFEPFMQVDNSMTRKFGGTGLGLALAKKFAGALGGDVRLVDSAIGKGSTFSITIDPGPTKDSPQITSLDTVLAAPEAVMAPGSAKADLKGVKVLLVEDALDNQFLVRRFLEMEGVVIEIANNGQEGCEKALAGSHDLVLMDIQMPVLDGYNATSRLRHDGYKQPIIAFTAHAFPAERERCLKLGFNDFLTKPIKRADLIGCISKYKPTG